MHPSEQMMNFNPPSFWQSFDEDGATAGCCGDTGRSECMIPAGFMSISDIA
jgi:hypothetical protein